MWLIVNFRDNKTLIRRLRNGVIKANFNIASNAKCERKTYKCVTRSLVRLPASLHSAYHWQHLSNPHHMAGDVLLNCFHLSRGAINFETRNSASPSTQEMPTQLSACNLSIHFGFYLVLWFVVSRVEIYVWEFLGLSFVEFFSFLRIVSIKIPDAGKVEIYSS